MPTESPYIEDFEVQLQTALADWAKERDSYRAENEQLRNMVRELGGNPDGVQETVWLQAKGARGGRTPR